MDRTITNENNKVFNLKFIDYFSLIDLSNEFPSIKERIKFSKKELVNLLLLNKEVDGIIVGKNISIDKFNKISNLFDDIPRVMLINDFVVITKLTVSAIHSTGLSFFCVVAVDYFHACNDRIRPQNEMTFALPGGVGNIQPDSSLRPLGRAPPNELIPTVVFDMFYSKGPSSAITQARKYLSIPGVLYVICVCTSPRDPNLNNRFKCVALLFDATISRLNPFSIISFGTKPISTRNENQYQAAIHGHNQPVGYKVSNPIQCNAHNIPMFVVNIPGAITFNGVPNPPDNIPPLIIDLYTLQHQYLESEPNFSATG